VRRGKGGKPRRQPLPSQLVARLERWHAEHDSSPTDPVFCGLGRGRLQPTILAGIIRRASTRAGIEKHVTAHTLRHTAATWLRQATGDTRLVAEYLGHSDLSTVSRYAHVANEELHIAAQALADGPAEAHDPATAPITERPTSRAAKHLHAGQLAAW
jgi:integrase